MAQTFKSEQQKFQRVREAYTEKGEFLTELYKEKGLSSISVDIYLRVFKYEQIIEVWGKAKTDSQFVHIKDFEFCSFSGKLGPKRVQGDSQTPEGFYYIDRFNPYSSFYLSLGINYPNLSDKKISKYDDLGGDIFIHGSCCTIGCIPITDDKIKELYIMAVEAKNNGQLKIPVHIFPAKVSQEQLSKLTEKYGEDNELIIFWTNLKEGYDYFETHKLIPQYSIDENGKYIFK